MKAPFRPAPRAPSAGAGPDRIRWRLAGLGLAVLAIHLLVLQAAPDSLDLAEAPLATKALLTRSLPAAVPADTATPAPAVRPPPPPVVRAPPKPRPPATATRPEALLQSGEAAPAVSPEALRSEPSTPGQDTTASASVTPDTQGTPPQALAPAAPAPLPSTATAHDTTGPVVIAAPVRLQYEVSGEARGLTYSARAELLWQHDGTDYDARMSVSAFLVGSRTQRSTGRITPQGLAPQRFLDKSRSEQAAHFERDKNRITFSANTPEAVLLPGAQDRLSLFLQVGALLAGEPARFVPGSRLTVQTASAREAESWLFTVEAAESLTMAGQTLHTLKLVRSPRREYDSRVEAWFAPEMAFLPVRMRITQASGDFVDQQLHTMEPLANRK
jgi:Protein of unknown function (DUF3108)